MEQCRVLTALSALAHATRLEIVRLLVPHVSKGMAAGQIGEALSISASGLSFHLNNLEQAGLITSRREGRNVIYAADLAALDGVVGYLRKDCCGGQSCPTAAP